ncbi:MAG TPA: O-antigen ligase family protein, partial [Candidatus Tectomicrobia bacterium]|nr:O-antigen ligase family protein [Candidatus Tectomicrobia bacterium]
MWLLLAMILIMPYEASPYLHLADNFLGVFPDFTAIKALGLVGFAWAMLQLGAGDPAARHFAARPATLAMLFLTLVAFLALVHGSGLQHAVSRSLAFLTFMPFVLVAVASIDDLRRVLATMVLAYVIMFPYGLRQMLRFDSRFGTGVYEPNYLAALLVLLVPLAFALGASRDDPNRRLLWQGAGVVLVVMLFLTSSRGGFLGLMVATMVFLYRRRGPVVAFGALAVLLGAVVVVPTELGSRALATLFEDSRALPPGLEQSNRAHVALFWAGLRMIADHPLLGVGPDQFKSLSTAYTGFSQGNIAHNSYLEIGAEFGLPALLVFVLLLASTYRSLGRVAALGGVPAMREVAAWGEGLRAGLTGYLVAAFFISAQYEKLLWLTIFLTVVLVDVAARQLVAAAPASAPD